MADWEVPPAHEISESAEDAAQAPLADDPLPAENPAPAPGTAPPEVAESSAVHDDDEPPFLSQPADPLAELDSMPDDLRALQESLEQPTGSMSPVDVEAAASEATTSWEALVAAAATTASTDVAAVSPAAAETAVSADGAENFGTTEGELAAEPPGEDQGAEGGPTEDEGAEGEASAQLAEGEPSLDDIAPGTVAVGEAEEDEEVEELVAAPVTRVSWWPFVGYVVVWLGAAGYSVYQLRDTPIGQGVYETNLYRMSMLGGLSLLAAGPALLLIVWLASWIGRKNRRIGLMFISALVKGATATLLGAIIWIGAIVLIDYLRFGRPL